MLMKEKVKRDKPNLVIMQSDHKSLMLMDDQKWECVDQGDHRNIFGYEFLKVTGWTCHWSIPKKNSVYLFNMTELFQVVSYFNEHV